MSSFTRTNPVTGQVASEAEAMKPEIPHSLQRVVRSRRAGNWRDWFCPEDVRHYRPLVAGYMARYGYPDEWELNARPVISPEECSKYALRLDRERRGMSASTSG